MDSDELMESDEDVQTDDSQVEARSDAQVALMTSIQETLNHTESWIQSFLRSVDWTEEHLLQEEEKITCPIDSSHIMPKSHMDKHMTYCPLVSAGYTREEVEQEANKSSTLFYQQSQNVVSLQLDDATIKNVLGRNHSAELSRRPLPVTMERAMSEFSTNEKLRLYEFCAQTAKATNKMAALKAEEIQLLEKTGDASGNKPHSHLEQRAAERDLKRRRQSYRKKGVHTGNKSYTEVIREVIVQQTELLSDKWKQENPTKKLPDQEDNHDDDDHHGNSREGSPEKEARKVDDKVRSHRSSSEDSDSSSHSKRKHKHKNKKRKKHKNKSDRHKDEN